MKNFIGIFILFFFFLFCSPQALAKSDYVLPYPSLMPGSKLYLVQEAKDNLMRYWYFGSFGQFAYNLNRSDKFLVEAKTLFEYKQYLLADKALKKSDYFFERTFIYLNKANKENKNISAKKNILNQASLKHIEVLRELENELPENFVWQPEKSSSTKLNIKDDIDSSIRLRSKNL